MKKLLIIASIALVAVGGSGRLQLFPGSDVDLLILLPDGSQVAYGKQLERFVGLLWDIGLEVGHSVRTLAECLAEASNITVQTNLLEARFLTGNRALAGEMERAVRRQLNLREFFEAKQLEQQQRYARFHDTASLDRTLLTRLPAALDARPSLDLPASPPGARPPRGRAAVGGGGVRDARERCRRGTS